MKLKGSGGKVEEVAHAVLFLADRESSYKKRLQIMASVFTDL